ncbi:hypothetical protein CLAFUW4_07230 [Fulvia fulva]|uniref:Uncharacterized protein n=1 Tax=Passalora fulva TaxID=5499 RepID=A0A9Q8PBF1_PASFU|nr:uncharacterized protein CLAFUR5_07362 [Fulvia fulva]KAK4622114.1 hypothetical protein CLAFUR4_07238 [Fulvia fulva]KAK4622593.1 hypothetical protein CLAFUR0_07235 [Fulvia fulva]UJO19384.1 hypothetical protein CLAFUR5_07362 [Fulvia fulva]WPV16718.1 hypothetical protein CLAFUW4_07230 [Fulvia fulva]WPV31558.1 hypothetical protein CLAFUW7_07231 [Fulvia fulva]
MSTIAQANHPHQHKPSPKRSSLSPRLYTETRGDAYTRALGRNPQVADEDEDLPVWLNYLLNIVLNTALLLISTALLARIATIVGDQTATVAELVKNGACLVPELNSWHITNNTIISPLRLHTIAALYLLSIPLLASRSADGYSVTFQDFRSGMAVAAFVSVVGLGVWWVLVMGTLFVRDVVACGGAVREWVGRALVNETEVMREQYELVKSARARLVRVDGV